VQISCDTGIPLTSEYLGTLRYTEALRYAPKTVHRRMQADQNEKGVSVVRECWTRTGVEVEGRELA
jgi:hypothetical protein